MRAYLATLLMVAATVFAAEATAQNRPSSPRGEAATQISGKWIVVDYGRPILRGRTNIFGSGEAYGEAVNSGAAVWRAGANQSTRLSTEVDLMFGDAHLPAGEYSVFVDLKADGWTLIFSNHTAKENYPRRRRRTLGCIWLHPGHGCRARAHDHGRSPRFIRRIHNHVPRRDHVRRQDCALVGGPACDRILHDA